MNTQSSSKTMARKCSRCGHRYDSHGARTECPTGLPDGLGGPRFAVEETVKHVTDKLRPAGIITIRDRFVIHLYGGLNYVNVILDVNVDPSAPPEWRLVGGRIPIETACRYVNDVMALTDRESVTLTGIVDRLALAAVGRE